MISEVPLPEQRLCKKHGTPIMPSAWKAGYRSSRCSKCRRERYYNADGTLKASAELRRTRRNKIRSSIANYKRTLRNRKYKGVRLQGIELFNRSIGCDLISKTGAIQI